jgi:hypothetical protein
MAGHFPGPALVERMSSGSKHFRIRGGLRCVGVTRAGCCGRVLEAETATAPARRATGHSLTVYCI